MQEEKSVSVQVAGKPMEFIQGRYAHQATGAVFAKYGDTEILVAAVMNKEPNPDMDWFPLTIEYDEKFYAAGKIKGSRFMKRSGRPSEDAILNARVIDRPIRPLFPKGTVNDVIITITVLSIDGETDAAITAINAASAALMVSGMPFDGPIAAVKMGMTQEGELIVNPTLEQEENGKLSLMVAGTEHAVTMVECAAKEVSEEQVLAALEMAQKEITNLCVAQKELKAKVNPTELEVTINKTPQEVIDMVAGAVTKEELDQITGASKNEVKEKAKAVETKILEKFAAQIEAEEVSEKHLKDAIHKAHEKNMRANVLEKEVRLDGRKLDEVRALSSKVGALSKVHGSGVFQRGETQVMSVVTLGGPGDAQLLDTMEHDDILLRYFHHYNFPSFSVGEARAKRFTSRREIGHGDLAERALLPMLPDPEDFAYTMWVVSEVLSCNGSTSMGSVCGSTLALMDAGVPIKKPVSGIAMGLITDGEGNYKVLSDIRGEEDFAGDMDFKVAGTDDGITALQMDIKVKGLSMDIMRAALAQAKVGRKTIMDSMLAVISAPRTALSPNAPMLESFRIDEEMIRVVIGKGGETIQKISADYDVEINIEDDGMVTVTAQTQEGGNGAVKFIQDLVKVPEAGEVYDAKVVKIMDFGAFVEFMPGKEGLVHISKLSSERVEKVEDVVKMGDTFKVKLLEVDSQGRYNLSKKDAE